MFEHQSTDFIGVILAAGIGSRLRPMTNAKPKCLIKTAGRPILQYQIDSYVAAGVKQVIIIVGHEGDAVREYCKHIKDVNITIVTNDDYEVTNNMYSLYLAREFLTGRRFILNNGDVSIDQSIIGKLIAFDVADAVAVDSSQFNEESMKVEINSAGHIINISKKITEEAAFGCSIDFYKFSTKSGELLLREITNIVEVENNLKDWTEVALQRLFQSQTLKFVPCDISGQPWVEIDNYEDLAISDRTFSKFDAQLGEIKTVFFDLDGTIYVGSFVIPGAARVIEQMTKQGKEIYFLSNNSSKSKADYVARLQELSISTTPERIILSTDGLISYLRDIRVDQVHVLGTNSLKKTFLDEGFQIDSASPEYVIVGYDTELSYKKLTTACRHINNGVDIIATHCDVTCPSENGPIPDVGAFLQMIEATTGKVPVKIFGKPTPEMVDSIIQRHKVDKSTTLLVGDRMHTDILMSKSLGARSLLVLSGETSRDMLEHLEYEPDFVLNSVADIYR